MTHSRRRLLWLLPTIFYALFFSWYTDFDGPLTPDEIDRYSSLYEQRHGKPVPKRWLEFWHTDTGKAFYMVNIFDIAENPVLPPGIPADVPVDQMMGAYVKKVTALLFTSACHPVFRGDAVGGAVDHKGPVASEGWTGAGLMRWRSRRTFAEIMVMPPDAGDDIDYHALKLASVDTTLAFPTESILVFDLRFVLGLILLALTAVTDGILYRR